MRNLLGLLLFLPVVLAERLIRTDALLQCQSSTEFSAQKFEVKFFPNTSEAQVDVEITSAINGNFTVDVSLYVYGIHAFHTTVSGCDISNTICPIEPGRFDVSTNLTVPKEYIKDIPGVAYTVPNIDAYVEAKVYYVNADGEKISNRSVACVVAELSNDKTVQHPYVSWILFGIIMGGVVISLCIAVFGNNTRTANQIITNTIALFTYFQAIAIVASMAVYRLPPIAAAWAQNFVWTLGIFSVTFMQKACYWYVKSTGGSATNILANKDDLSIAVFKKRAVTDEAIDIASHLAKRISIQMSGNLTTTNEKDPNVLGKTLVLRGIDRVAYLANVELSNFFVTGAASFIFIGIFLVIALVLVKFVLEFCARMNWMASERALDFRTNYRGYTKGSLFRYFSMGFTQLSMLCLWEFTDRESAGTTVVAVVMFAILMISLLVASTRVLILGGRSRAMFKNPASILFGNHDVLRKWGFLYIQYKSSAYWFLFPALLYNFARSATIGLGQSSGKAQSVVLVVIEVLYFLLLCIVRPYMSKSMNGYNIAISVFSIVNAIFFMFFSRLFGDSIDVGAAIIGIVYFVMNAVVCFAYLVALVVECLIAIIHPHPDDRYEPVSDDRNLFMHDVADKQGNAELNDLGSSARDGYRLSYLNYDPQFSNQAYGVTATGSHEGFPAPEAAQSSSFHAGHEYSDSFNYREQQSRGVLRGYSPEKPHAPEDRLI